MSYTLAQSEKPALRNTSLAMAVHDLRGYLTIVAGQAKLLRAGKLGVVTSLQVDALTDIVAGCYKIEEQIALILAGKNAESSQWVPALQTGDLRECLSRIHASLLPEFSDCCLQFKLRLANTAIRVPFDESLITRVLLNLLENARRFTPPGGSIALSLKSHFWERRNADVRPEVERRSHKSQKVTNAVKIVVSDSGCGITPGNRQKIFEEYFSTPSLTGQASSGLGLAIAQKVVQAHGGKLWVESSVGKGSKFCFFLPLSVPSSTNRSTLQNKEAAHA